VFIKIGGKTHYLWRAVDQHGTVLDILVTSRRDTKAATRFFRTLLTGLEYVPRVLVTDKLGSYQAARRTVSGSVEHRQSKYLNNRAENSHQPTRDEKGQLARWRTTVPVRVQWDITTFPGLIGPEQVDNAISMASWAAGTNSSNTDLTMRTVPLGAVVHPAADRCSMALPAYRVRSLVRGRDLREGRRTVGDLY
jgi:hypothetical protein